MKKIKYLFILFLSLFIMVGCDNSNESNVPSSSKFNSDIEEITYNEFKAEYNSKESINYNHVKISRFIGYIDDLQDRKSDGTPIFKEISMNYKNGDWYNDLGDMYAVIDLSSMFYYLDDSGVETYGNPPENIKSVSYYKIGDNYKVIIRATEHTHIFNPSQNAMTYPATATIWYNKYFYMTDYKKEMDELLPIRAHDNLILWEEHVRWDLNILANQKYQVESYESDKELDNEQKQFLDQMIGLEIEFVGNMNFYFLGNSNGIYFIDENNNYKHIIKAMFNHGVEIDLPESLWKEIIIEIKDDDNIILESCYGFGNGDTFIEDTIYYKAKKVIS